MGNEEVEGVRVLHTALTDLPMEYVLLDTQAEFLLKKAQTATTPEQKEERLRLGEGCADRSTIAAPSEFGTWARLAEVYVAMEDWENALTILNSCPMFTYQDKDAPLMPEPKDVYLPTLPETRLDEIDSEPESRYSEQVEASLMNLRAANYRGTFKKAYSILTEMTAKIGWDQLLKIRSNVFVMEDEYRTEKHDPTPSKRGASTDVIRGTPEPTANGDQSDEENGAEVASKTGDTLEPGSSAINGVGESVEKPTSTVDPVEAKAAEENVSPWSPATLCPRASSVASTNIRTQGDALQPEEHLSRLNNKRLCERWLDSLFMVLYEDLRVYTIWRTQMAQYRAQSIQYKKSAEEWEILGALAERLQHNDEAVEAYSACLDQRFSPKAMAGILRVQAKHKDTRKMVHAVIKLVTWQYRWYSEFSPELLHTIRTLIEDEGAVKVRSIIQATSLPQPVLDLTHYYAALCATFRSGGTDS